MKHLSLFSGIGGFDLAAEWMGWENIAHCEWNAFGRQVLKYYWPEAISYEDITKTDFTVHRGTIDILTGGFPCQPYSVAGKRKGKDDDRHLWPEMLRAIREIQPRWVVGENVRGLVNWDGGLVFEEVQADLESQGYKILTFLLPASGIGAPHQRERIWFVADRNSPGFQKKGAEFETTRIKQHRKLGNNVTNTTSRAERSSGTSSEPESIWSKNNYEQKSWGIKTKFNNGCRELLRDASDTNCGRQSSKEHWKEKSRWPSEKSIPRNWENFPTQSPICDGDDGFPAKLDGITFPKWRNESIKAGGNAIVPQVAFQIFKAIQEYEKLNNQ